MHLIFISSADVIKMAATRISGTITILNCMSYYRFYEATIEDIGESSLKVKFEGYTTLETVSILDVKSLGTGTKRPLTGDESK